MGNNAESSKAVYLVTLTAVTAALMVLTGALMTPAHAQPSDEEKDDPTAGQCLALINNSGDQYNASIIQNCIQIINEAANGGGDDDGNDTPTGNGTTPLNGGTDLDDGVLTNTIPAKALPVTGGTSILVVAGIALLGVGLGISLIRRR